MPTRAGEAWVEETPLREATKQKEEGAGQRHGRGHMASGLKSALSRHGL